ncbi:MAG: putative restriction endonuclease [Rhodospirillaceae bacterium]|jgi:putative restriction endonuclease|nr:putative restriction endonuclease [Rhodospirillaceae bacterium]
MAKAVFTTKVAPAYDDLPEERYHFPRTYIRRVEATVGDWAFAMNRGERPADLSSRQAYFATARVRAIVPDPVRADHFYALICDYLELDVNISFRETDLYYESMLKREDGQTNKGAFGRAVRPLSDLEHTSCGRVWAALLANCAAAAKPRSDGRHNFR